MKTAVAIDGPAGAGKSTLARKLAEHLGFIYVDTGALYRTVALSLIDAKIDIGDLQAVDKQLENIAVNIVYNGDEQRVLLNGTDVSDDIRTPEVSMMSSKCSAIPAVRIFLLELQRQLARINDVVMDGRDIGTVVLPDAKIKIYLTADAEIRAKRRYDELIAKDSSIKFEEVLDDLKQRDYNDMNRAVSPLKVADNAVVADTSGLSFDESLELLMKIVRSESE